MVLNSTNQTYNGAPKNDIEKSGKATSFELESQHSVKGIKL
jgi:hypothetical protein